MADTIAIPQELLDTMNNGRGQPLCPGCSGGRLHPYYVSFQTSIVPGHGWQGADYLTGFVAVCTGNLTHLRKGAKEGGTFDPADVLPPCGFSMPLTAGRHGG